MTDAKPMHKYNVVKGVPGILATPCDLGGIGYECPNCNGRFRTLRKSGGRKRTNTIPRHAVVIMTSTGIKQGESLCDGWGEYPTEETPGHYPAWMRTVEERRNA